MANKKVTPGSLTDAYKQRKGDFSPDLVGFQLTKGTPLFTLGNFGVTVNLDPKTDTYFNTGIFSNPYTLENLDLTEQESELLVSNDIYTTLNLDPTDVSKFSYYGSFVEFLRVSIEGIITKWKGSLYITDDEGGFSRTVKNTVLGYSYNSLTNKSTIKIPTLFVQNKFDLITNDLGGLILDARDISNIKLSYTNYEIKNDYGTFNLLGYTGNTENVNPYIDVVVEGEAFPTLTGSSYGTFKYHLKPKDNIVDRLFFDTLTDFENILLNRLSSPRYSSTYESPVDTESGTLLSVRKTFTWPTTDGFNIDIDTTKYSQFISDILKMASDYDRFRGNLMTRRFISNSIIEFDTEGEGDNSQGRKIDKLLKIYGREFDEVKKYVDSIQDAHVVTYDKKNNMPDELIKDMARTLGFEAIKSVSDNQLLSYIAKSNEIIFSGHSRSMSTKEIDTELWRRLVINAWWLFKSKGHRKVIEFLVKLFGLNECLVNIDECVYVVKDKLDVEETFAKIEEILNRDLLSGDTIDTVTPGQIIEVDRDEYPIDEQGFPRTLPNRPDYYFQMHGFWYNNGTQRTVGNNPHFGPYDYGSAYFDKFRCFIDDFSGKTEVIRQEYIENVNLFPDYNHGDLEITFEDGKPLMDYGPTYAQIMEDGHRVSEMTNLISAGFTTEKSRTGRGSLKLTFTCGDDSCDVPCPKFVIDEKTGTVDILTDPNSEVINLSNTPLDMECCKYYGFEWASTSVSEIYVQGLDEKSVGLIQRYVAQMIKKYGKYFFDENPNSCFWCKPTIPVCNFETYLTTIYNEEGIDGIIEILLTEGLITQDEVKDFIIKFNENPREIGIRIIKYFNNIYGNYCLIVHEDFGEVSEKCCKIRGGEWVDINSTRNSEVQQPPKYKCVIPKEIEPPVDPCLCVLPEYCEYKKPVVGYLMEGLHWLDCPDISNEIGGWTKEIVGDRFTLWRQQRDAFMKYQNEAILAGYTLDEVLGGKPVYNAQCGYVCGYPFGQSGPGWWSAPVPTPVPGFESWTGYDKWQIVNMSNGCTDEFYNWVSDGEFDSNGNPTGQATAPCDSPECDGRADGEVYTTDYEDILTTNRATRDASLKAKNQLILAMGPYIEANESIPLYFLEQCGYGCGKECNCEEINQQAAVCPEKVDVSRISCDEYVKKLGGVNEQGVKLDCGCSTSTSTTICLGGGSAGAPDLQEITGYYNGTLGPITDLECCKTSATQLGLNPNEWSIHNGVGCFRAYFYNRK